MARCEICGKIPQSGNSVSHSKRHTKRKWLPNVQNTNVVVNGRKTRLKICMRCLRTRQKISQ